MRMHDDPTIVSRPTFLRSIIFPFSRFYKYGASVIIQYIFEFLYTPLFSHLVQALDVGGLATDVFAFADSQSRGTPFYKSSITQTFHT